MDPIIVALSNGYATNFSAGITTYNVYSVYSVQYNTVYSVQYCIQYMENLGRVKLNHWLTCAVVFVF